MINEDQLEQLAIQWFQETGWTYAHGPDISPEGIAQERDDYAAVVLKPRLVDAVARLNPGLPPAAVEEVVLLATKPEEPSLGMNNYAFHRRLLDGVTIDFKTEDGESDTEDAKLIDFVHLERNDFLIVNQFTITGTKRPRRPDIIVFVNGLPLAVLELKNPADATADIWKAYEQLQTYKDEISDLFVFNEALVISDGTNARIGSLTASREWFLPWLEEQVHGAVDKAVPGEMGYLFWDQDQYRPMLSEILWSELQ